MKKTALTLSAAALALTGTAVLAQNMGGKHSPDADSDGIITRAEMTTHADQMFARMDANGDGVINAEDRTARRSAKLATADTNGDGELSQAEMQAMHEARKERREERSEERAERRAERMAERFAQADKDNSGGLSQEELQAMHEARGERGHRGHEGRRGGKRGHRGGGMHMMRYADANGDKTITRAEFDKAVAEQFAKTDTDGDGQVTTEEMQARHKEMRAKIRAEREARAQ